MSQREAWCLDYGHGGTIDGVYQTKGKRYQFDEGTLALEGVINRMVARALVGVLFDTLDPPRVFDAVAGHEFDDAQADARRYVCPYDVPLDTRITWANRYWRTYRAPLVSIHTNAIGNESQGPSLPARGISVFTSPNDTQSDEIATRLFEAFEVMEGVGGLPVRRGDWSDGDPDHERRFAVLTKTEGPAVLVEGGFFTNLDDVRFLHTWHGQWLMASGYALGMTGRLPMDRWCFFERRGLDVDEL